MQSADSAKLPNSPGRIIIALDELPKRLAIEEDSRKWKIVDRPGRALVKGGLLNLKRRNVESIVVGWVGEVLKYKEEFSNKHYDLEAHHSKFPYAHSSVTVSDSEIDQCEKQLAENTDYGLLVPVWIKEQVSRTFQRPQSRSSQSDTTQEVYYQVSDSKIAKYPQVLWSCLHYRYHSCDSANDVEAGADAWNEFIKFNQAYCDTILKLYKPGDIIVIHNYTLMLLPQLLRGKILNASIAFYMQCVFPSSEIFRCLPNRTQILRGVLGANLVSFQSSVYGAHFISCCKRILGLDVDKTKIDAAQTMVDIESIPQTIDVDEVLKGLHRDEVKISRQKIHASHGLFKIIVARDPMHEVKGPILKLKAFQTFLERYPEWRRKVVFFHVTSPVPNNSSCKKVSQQYEVLASQINGLYGDLDYTPILHYHQHLPNFEYFALLSEGSVCLDTSIRSAVDVTSLEFAVCQNENEDPGIVICSEFTGVNCTFEGGSLVVNPWDKVQVADAIQSALTMPKEKRQEYNSVLFNTIKDLSEKNWIEVLLEQLKIQIDLQKKQLTPLVNTNAVLKTYKKANHRFFALDYDGTLTDIVSDPSAAIPSERVLRVLKRLSADPKNEVWIISGRDQKFLDLWMGNILSLGLSAEHGCFKKEPGSTEWETILHQKDLQWIDEVRKVFQFYTDRTQGSFIEEKKCAITWHYRKADPDYGQFQANVCRNQIERLLLNQYDIEVLSGKMCIEVRPRHINKGYIMNSLLDKFSSCDFVICAGDDRTDEDMFEVARKHPLLYPEDSFSVAVGLGKNNTKAACHVPTPKEMINLLSALTGLE